MTQDFAESSDSGPAVDYVWQRPYMQAVLETDRSKLRSRIEAAERAIKSRTHELSQDHQGTAAERQAIEDAIHSLAVLREEVAR